MTLYSLKQICISFTAIKVFTAKKIIFKSKNRVFIFKKWVFKVKK